MTDDAKVDPEQADAAPRKGGRKQLLVALVLFLVLGGAGFYATFSGMLAIPGLGGGAAEPDHAEASHPSPTEFAFAPVGELVVPLGPRANSEFLILEAEIEVAPEDKAALEAQMPRIRDMFNTYLRAVEARDLEAQDATLRLRAHLLRRITVLVVPLQPRDLLFTTFILK